jgi:hypothetical protein
VKKMMIFRIFPFSVLVYKVCSAPAVLRPVNTFSKTELEFFGLHFYSARDALRPNLASWISALRKRPPHAHHPATPLLSEEESFDSGDKVSFVLFLVLASSAAAIYAFFW